MPNYFQPRPGRPDQCENCEKPFMDHYNGTCLAPDDSPRNEGPVKYRIATDAEMDGTS